MRLMAVMASSLSSFRPEHQHFYRIRLEESMPIDRNLSVLGPQKGRPHNICLPQGISQTEYIHFNYYYLFFLKKWLLSTCNFNSLSGNLKKITCFFNCNCISFFFFLSYQVKFNFHVHYHCFHHHQITCLWCLRKIC